MVDHQRDLLLPRDLEPAQYVVNCLVVRCVGDRGQVVDVVVERAPRRALRRLGLYALLDPCVWAPMDHLGQKRVLLQEGPRPSRPLHH